MFKEIRKNIFIFTIIFLIAGFYFLLPVQAGEILDINFFGYDPLFEEANFVPGESVSRLVEIENKTSESQAIAVKAEKNYDDGLGGQMEMRIMENAIMLYKNSMTNFLNAGEIYLSDLAPNKVSQYNFIVSFYKTVDNNYQGTKINFDINIGSQVGESIGGENGSSGGGYVYGDLIISNEGVVVNNNSATISWLTNKAATSRVIYDTTSHPDISLSSPPNYSYQFSNTEDSTKITGHSMEITGLSPNTQYFFRPLSKASPEKYGKELSFITTNTAEKIRVLGMEGEPNLELKNTITKEIAHPGDRGIECQIIINNNGDFPAYDVSLSGTLQEGLFYNGTQDGTRNWNIGDIGGGEFKSISYMIDINDRAEAGVYSNSVNLYASNHNTLNSSVSISVQKIEVLSMEFIKSGFSSKEFFLLFGIFIVLIILSFFIAKKVK